MKKYDEFKNISEQMVKKGDKVSVTMNYFKGTPTYEVEA